MGSGGVSLLEGLGLFLGVIYVRCGQQKGGGGNEIAEVYVRMVLGCFLEFFCVRAKLSRWESLIMTV